MGLQGTQIQRELRSWHLGRFHNRHWPSPDFYLFTLSQPHAHSSVRLVTQNPHSCFENQEVAMAQDSVIAVAQFSYL